MASSEEIKTILDITLRLDERVKIIQQGQGEIHTRFNQLSEDIISLMNRVTIIESKNGDKVHRLEDDMDDNLKRLMSIENRLVRLEDHTAGWSSKWKQYGDLVIRAIWAIVMGYLLWKLGIGNPPSP